MLIELPNAFSDAATNMAIDSALLNTLPEGLAVFRHYGWTEPAITFGYTQRHRQVQAVVDQELTLCRRLTGGGIVDHRNDWTYALILNTAVAAAKRPANDLYARVHQAIQNALSSQAIDTQLAPCPRKCNEAPEAPSASASQCFVTPAASDVLLPSGQKVAGAAMKRTRNGLLIQGSIDRATLPDTFKFDHFQTAFIQQLQTLLQLQTGTVEDLRMLFRSEQIEAEKLRFASSEWLTKR
ncbi:MAG: lipoate--protein ligase family protein [Opitutaceae bacterium]